MTCISLKALIAWLYISTIMTSLIGLFNLALGFSLWGLELNKISEGPPVVHIILGVLALLSGSCGFHGVLKGNPVRMGLFNVCNIFLFCLFVPFGILLIFFGKNIQDEMVCPEGVSVVDCLYQNRIYQKDRLGLILKYGIIVLAFAIWMLQNFLLTIFICAHKEKSDILLRSKDIKDKKNIETANLELKQSQDKSTKYQLVNNTTEANDTKV